MFLCVFYKGYEKYQKNNSNNAWCKILFVYNCSCSNEYCIRGEGEWKREYKVMRFNNIELECHLIQWSWKVE